MAEKQYSPETLKRRALNAAMKRRPPLSNPSAASATRARRVEPSSKESHFPGSPLISAGSGGNRSCLRTF
jgi:hypothetical protein